MGPKGKNKHPLKKFNQVQQNVKKRAPPSKQKKAQTLTEKKKSSKHKDSLAKLKEQDPEFFKFLENEDRKLLNYSGSEDDDLSSSDDGDRSDGDSRTQNPSASKKKSKVSKKNEKPKSGKREQPEKMDYSSDSDDEGGFHKLPTTLEEASDSDDEEEMLSDDDDDDAGETQQRNERKPVTLKLIDEWTLALRQSSNKVLPQVTQAFRAAVQCAGSETVAKSPFHVKGSTVFNAVVRMCLKELPLMLVKHLTYPKAKKEQLPSSSPQWRPIRKHMMSYLSDLVELMSQMSESEVLNVVLKHVTQMIPYFACFAKLGKTLLKRLVQYWSGGGEATRVLAFLSINRLVRFKQDLFLEFTLKQMYIAYVKNCKFTSPSTLPLINFMQRSLVEIFAVDQEMTYQYAFVYIRQLAIHLRNAITVKKKDTCQLVYNWQYVHSIQLWTRTLSQLYPSPTLEPLIYPLVQVTIGTIKLIPTAKYYPLRFHCIQCLNMLSTSTKVFIPVLPFLIEMFDLTDFNKKFKKASIKPFNFACIIKMSKSQLHEKTFLDGVLDQIYEHLMETFSAHTHCIGFPELVLPATLQMKKFIKQCKVSNYTKQIKQILDKVQETSNVITLRRKSATLNLADKRAVDQWEGKSKAEGTPLGKYYAIWRKLRDRELQQIMSSKEHISVDDLPVIERPQRVTKKATAVDRKEFSGLFNSASEEDEDADSDNETRFLLREERPAKKQRLSDDEEDQFTEKELARLAESASEDEDDDDSIEVESGSDEDAELDDDEIDDQGDIVEDFQFSSDDEA